MAAELQAVANLLQQSLDPRQHRQAEASIEQLQQGTGFSIALLQIVGSDSFPQTARLAAALYFKNFVRRGWVDEEGNHKLPQNEVSQIKGELVSLMIACPPSIQAQLGDAISLIADSDFWVRWDTLVDDLVSKMSPDNPVVTIGVLQVAHSIFKRWRPLFRSDELFTEINHVVGKFGIPFLNLLSTTDTVIQQNVSNADLLGKQMAVMNTSIKVLYDLSCQDLPETLVENLDALVGLLDRYLQYENPLLRTDEDSAAGTLEFVKAGILELLTLYAQKYEEDINKHVAGLLSTSWNLLTALGAETKYDILASRALHFLTSVTKFSTHAQNFNNEDTLRQVIEKATLPNIALRESDIEMFEDEPIEYIRRDLEGADSETRRRAATDFLRQLMEQFPSIVTNITLTYIQHFMQEYSSNPSEKWQSKDTAIYLFCSIAAVGTGTAAGGIMATNPNVNIIEFFQSHVAQDLLSESTHPILQVDAIKYLYLFRSQLTGEQWTQAFPMLVRHLGSSNYVVHTYCAIAVERILALTGPNGKPVMPAEQVQPQADAMLRQLFKLITKNSAPEKIQENEFLMRCVMRILIIIREGALSIVDFLLASFSNITKLIRHNPSNPRFYYYLFESTGAVIRFCAPSQPQKLETSLFEPFAVALQDQVTEFIPYIFQLFAALLEANPSEGLPDFYSNLIGPVLSGSLWESRGNAPALTRLLCALLRRGAGMMVENNQLEPVLGIFQNLIASKSTETSAFELLETVIDTVPNAKLNPYYSQIFNLLLTRLHGSKTEGLTQRFVRLYHFMASKDPSTGLGADNVVVIIDAVQAGLFGQIYTSIVLPETHKLSRPMDRKLAIVALTRTLCESRAFADRFAKGWGYTCEALLKLLVDPLVPATNDDVIMEHDVDDITFGVGFTQLVTCRRPVRDPFPEISDASKWTGNALSEASRKDPAINSYVENRLSPEAKQKLALYMRPSAS